MLDHLYWTCYTNTTYAGSFLNRFIGGAPNHLHGASMSAEHRKGRQMARLNGAHIL